MNDSNEINLLIVENIDLEEEKAIKAIKEEKAIKAIKEEKEEKAIKAIKEEKAIKAIKEEKEEKEEKNIIYFAIGIRSPTNYGNQRKRSYISDVIVRNNKKIKLTSQEINIKLKNVKKIKQKKIQKKQVIQEKPHLKKIAADMFNLFEDVNPFYMSTRVDMKVNDKKKKFEISAKYVTKAQQIKIIIPRVKPVETKTEKPVETKAAVETEEVEGAAEAAEAAEAEAAEAEAAEAEETEAAEETEETEETEAAEAVETNAYHYLSYQIGTLFDWQVTLLEIDDGQTIFNFPINKKEKIFKFKIPEKNQILAYDVYEAALEIYENNQWVRWQMKALLNAWLVKKSKKRCIGEDCDILTGGEIPKDEQIRVISIKNRTEYVFSGAVLTKSAKTCLEGQTAAIPFIKSPHNPFTNTPFSYGEMTHVYLEILRWCGNKGKALPAIIGLYREAKFKNNIILRMNNNYVQLKAAHSYILNDDTTGEFFIEIMELLLAEFGLLLSSEFNSLIIGYQRFRLWNKMEPTNYLIILWKRLAADYWYFRQTEQFSRENWRSESSIYMDLYILMRASTDKLTNIMTEYYRGRHYIYVDDEDI